GGNTFISWLITTAGGVNIAAKFAGWPMLDYEYILSHDPDVIIISAMGSDYATLSKEISETPLAQTKAFKTGRVYLVDQEANDVLVRPGPRLGLAIRVMASILFPDVFGEPKVPVIYRVSERASSITSASTTIRLSIVEAVTRMAAAT
ncbi:MAG: ABC transporter substrate-binding protein, partial [Sulfolobales archaeon]